MSSSRAEPATRIRASGLRIAPDGFTVELSDGRALSVPYAWYPRLQHGRPEEREHWELIGNGDGIHWPDLDEDISVEGLLAGRRSGESERSLQAWLDRRKRNEQQAT